MVIQRWQSVLLLCAVIMMVCFSFLSLGQIQMPEYTLNFTALGFRIEGEATAGGPAGWITYTWPLFIISLIAMILPAITIFCYKNLKLQKRLCLIELVLIVGVIGCGCVYGYRTFAPDYSVSWSSLALAPVIAFLADLFAYQRICADARLLREADRIR